MSGGPFSVSTEESHAILKTVLPLMSKHRVPTIPQNYSVWYDYVCESDPSLVTELEERIRSGLDFSPEYCHQVHERFFVEPIRSQVGEIQAAMREAMGAVLAELKGLDDDLGEFGSMLDDTGESLVRDPTREELTAMVARLVEQTRTTRERSARTEASLSSMAAQVEELRLQVDTLSRDAMLDALTDVPNRRAFEDGLARMTAEAESQDQEMCLLLADVDHFKKLNDTHGHVAGDHVLRFIAQEIKQCVKGRDLLCRYGGEEFAVLLPATSYDGALMLAESIRAIIEAQVVPLEDGTMLEDLTLSIGVALYRAGETGNALVDRADRCMYQCKSEGRNRVVGERDLMDGEAAQQRAG
jgi:diguanylate cyclase